MADVGKNNNDVQLSLYEASQINRSTFTNDFVFGCATSAYQVEGAYDEGGKGLNNWDVFALRRPNKIQDGTNGCVAIDQYHKYKEDVMCMKRLGLKAYRFSISWARILPGGRRNAGVNREGVQFYNDLIDFCIEQAIEPYVTIFHFDVPQCLEDEYGGFLSSKIIQDFAEYAEVCYWEFGDRVKYWITQNEPWTFAHNGYVAGAFPPGHGNAPPVQPPEHRGCSANACFTHRCAPLKQTTEIPIPNPGDAGTEPYIVAHNLILSHAVAYDIYKTKFKDAQGGVAGITNMTTWYLPYDPTKQEDIDAARRSVDFMWGWFMSPIVHGDYPEVMKTNVGSRLPQFTDAQKLFIKDTYDFIGMNYYTTNYAIAAPPPPPGTPNTYYTDKNAAYVTERNGVSIGDAPGSPWLFIYPRGLYHLLMHTKEVYGDPLIYITEQGISITNDPDLHVTAGIQDDIRISAYQQHLSMVKRAIDHGVNVKAYFLWSMFDNYEWAEGYAVRFGIIYVDYVNKLNRYPKSSALWWMKFLSFHQRNKRLVTEENASAKAIVAEVDHENAAAAKRSKRGRT